MAKSLLWTDSKCAKTVQIWCSCQELKSCQRTITTMTPLTRQWPKVIWRYQIWSHVFDLCSSQKTYCLARIACTRFSHGHRFFDSHNVQKSVTQIIYLGPLPTTDDIQGIEKLKRAQKYKGASVSALTSSVPHNMAHGLQTGDGSCALHQKPG